MGKFKIILVDTDVVSHFLVASQLHNMARILSPNLIFIVENVYRELSRRRDRISTIDQWISDDRITRIAFPFGNEKVRLEYYRIKKESGIRIGDGERACMAMARYGKEVLASSNFRDVKPYADENGIEYLGFIDILYIALHRNILSEAECDKAISDALRINSARVPVRRISDYVPDRDLSYFIGHA